ncbi:hypothetical protein ACHAO9_005018 [Fusarium lateritium]
MRPFALSTALFAASTLAQKSSADVECADGLYMIAARGTGEDKGAGVIGRIAQNVAKRVKGSVVEPLDYPASWQDPDYEESEAAGVKAMTAAVNEYHSSCPDGKIAVFGYSQGGQVASDSFCGGSGGDFPTNKPLAQDLVQDSVVAIIIFGDPSHVANISYDQGNSINDGIFERNNTKLCEDNYSKIIRSYCDTGDVYCDGGNNTATHSGYFSKYGNEVVDFVVKQYESAASETKTTASSTATAATETTGSATGAAETTPAVAPGNAAAGLVPGLALAMVPLVLALSQLL